MFHAMEDCGAGMAIRQAAEVHGVPRQTLADRLSGQLTHGCCSGPPTLHAPEVENYLVQYCIYCTSHGFPFTRQRLMKYAGFGTQGRQSHHWGRGAQKSSTGHLCHANHGTTLRRHHLLCSLRGA
ncbi:hypothetical protein J4Q44_G00373150 [Coregonus suidteri]|uniref:HTH psq-type domain-containing protein n=1 Tax=Coregonus suidteri TaxID=861788 RepID=A0AAN8Q6B6_9TELE